MTGIWTIVLSIGNFLGGWLSDYVGRKRQMRKYWVPVVLITLINNPVLPKLTFVSQ
jgi:MFS family permease